MKSKKKIFGILMTLLAIAVGIGTTLLIDHVAGIIGGGATLAMALAGYTRECQASSGGVVTLWITENANLTSYTLAGEEYTAVTMDGLAVFYKYEFQQDTCSFKEELVITDTGAKIVTHTIEVKLDFMNADARTEIEALADASACGLQAIVMDANAQMWAVGYSEKFLKERPLRLKTATGDSGKKLDDENGEVLTLVAMDTSKAREFTGTVPV